VRPLYKDQDVKDDRDISRTYKLLDHEARDGVKGLISMVGGKWTTYRLMAQEATDAVAAKLGVAAECRTHLERLEARDLRLVDGRSVQASSLKPQASFFWLGEPLAQVENDNSYGDLICECELVTRDHVIKAITEGRAANIDDIRRDTRLGMGPCQGGFCTYRAVALWEEIRGNGHEVMDHRSPSQAPITHNPLPMTSPSVALLRHFLQERWKGITAIAWGDQLRQARLDEIIYLDTLGVDLLPQPAPESQNSEGMVTAHPAIATEYHTA
jgi:glycerol-3-phosphate dehydrogenase